MKTRGMLLRSGGVVLLLLLAAILPRATVAAEGRSPGSVNSSLASSSLPEADRAVVRAKAADAVGAGLPADDVAIIVARSVDRGVSADTIGRFLDAALAARKEGASAGAVLDRIEQGLSKGVPADRIAAAAERLSGKLVIARALVDGLARGGLKAGRNADRDEAIEGTARALEKSVAEESLKAMGEAVKARGGTMSLYAVAANTTAYCVSNGMSPAAAGRLVGTSLEKGYSGRDLDAMVRLMNKEMQRGATMNDIAAKLEREGLSTGRELEREDMRETMRPDHGRGGGMGGAGMGGRGR